MKVVIAGAGISATIAAWALREHDVSMICPSGQIGGQWAAGPWRMCPDTDEMRAMLDDLDVPYESETIKPHGAVIFGRHAFDALRLPVEFDMAADDLAAKVYASVPRKQQPPAIDVFSEPELARPKAKHLHFAVDELFAACEADVYQGRIDRFESHKGQNVARLADGERLPFDLFVCACPIAQIASSLPRAMRARWPRQAYALLDLYHATPQRHSDFFLANDYILTPSFDAVFRASHSKDGAWLEAAAGAALETVQRDAVRLLGTCEVRKVNELRGKPYGDAPNKNDLPKWMVAVGPYALASSCETPSDTLRRMQAVARSLR